MENLPTVKDLKVAGKRVLVRMDLDCEASSDDFRIRASIETLDYLYQQKAQIIILGHKGRPSEASDEEKQKLSLKPFESVFSKWEATVKENLRFNEGEEKNDIRFAEEMASWGDCYVNEAFASSHRSHASTVSLAKIMKEKSAGSVAVGIRFAREIEYLSKLFNDPARPVVAVLGGVKEDKAWYIEEVAKFADKILIGGRLPLYFGEDSLKSVSLVGDDEIALYANLLPDKEDITLSTIERFEKEIAKAKTILVAGPMGKYEEEGHRQGTEKVFRAVAQSQAYKIAAGGNTQKAIELFSLADKFEWISVGGGAALEFLTKKTLPAIEAIES